VTSAAGPPRARCRNPARDRERHLVLDAGSACVDGSTRLSDGRRLVSDWCSIAFGVGSSGRRPDLCPLHRRCRLSDREPAARCLRQTGSCGLCVAALSRRSSDRKLYPCTASATTGRPSAPGADLVGPDHSGVLAGFLGLLLATPLVAAGLVIVRMVYVEDVLGDRTIAEPAPFEDPAPYRDPEHGVPGSPVA
jgi:hypothetical protein